MTSASLLADHLSDGDLVRLLDGEEALRDDVEAHLARCAECQRRLSVLRRRSERLSGLLIATDAALPEPDMLTARRLRRQQQAQRGLAQRAVPGWMRAAAAVVLLLGGVMLAEPVRAWVADWLGARWAELTGSTPPEPAQVPVVVEPVPEANTRVQFTPASDEVELRFASAQAGGVVAVEIGDVPEVSVQVQGGTADLLVLPGGVRIANRPESVAEYRVEVPARVQRLRVQIGEGKPVILSGDQLAAGQRIPLSPR